MKKLFAWNEGNNNKGRNDGPPELDELFKNFQKWLNKMTGNKKPNINFGGPSSDSGDDNNNFAKQGSIFLFLGAIVLAVIIAISGFFKVEPGEQAAVYRFGKFIDIEDQGPHWIFPGIYSKQIVNVDQVQQLRFADNLITKELNIVKVALVVQYKIKNLENYLFKVKSPEQSLSEATRSAIRHVIADSTLNDVLSTQGNVSTTFMGDQIKELVVKNIDYYQTGLEIQGVEVEAVLPPDPVKEAFNDAIQAQEDKERFKNQAEAYERKVVPTAEGDAQKIIQASNGYAARVVFAAEGDVSRFVAVLPEYSRAPKVTRDRMYIKAMEETLKSTPKIMVDTKSNNVLFLPLDKLSNSLSKAVTKSNNQDIHNENSSGNPNLAKLDNNTAYDHTSSRDGNRDGDRNSGRSWRN